MPGIPWRPRPRSGPGTAPDYSAALPGGGEVAHVGVAGAHGGHRIAVVPGRAGVRPDRWLRAAGEDPGRLAGRAVRDVLPRRRDHDRAPEDRRRDPANRLGT